MTIALNGIISLKPPINDSDSTKYMNIFSHIISKFEPISMLVIWFFEKWYVDVVLRGRKVWIFSDGHFLCFFHCETIFHYTDVTWPEIGTCFMFEFASCEFVHASHSVYEWFWWVWNSRPQRKFISFQLVDPCVRFQLSEMNLKATSINLITANSFLSGERQGTDEMVVLITEEFCLSHRSLYLHRCVLIISRACTQTHSS